MKNLGNLQLAILVWALSWMQARAEVKLHTVEDSVTNQLVVIATGFSSHDSAKLAKLSTENSKGLSALLKVYVKEAVQAGKRQAVLGATSWSSGALTFRPRFAFQPGLAYQAEYARDGSEPVVRHEFTLPKPVHVASAEVSTVYPTAQVLPQNLLKFYVHFTAPMSQGDAYEYVRLEKADGTAVEHPFLEIDEELWDHSGKRLTLLMDPGRVKRGLVPREQDGPILVEGQKYWLTILAAWPDSEGIPMVKPFVKTFSVGPEDFTQPDPTNWRLIPPRAKTLEPFTFEFPEPLDHATFARGVTLENGKGEVVRGDITFSADERRAHFTPLKQWKVGLFDLRISNVIEDLAGNSIERAFEVDRFNKVESAAVKRKSFSVEIR